MKNLVTFLNELRLNAGAIWFENGDIIFSAPKKFQNQETKDFITNNKIHITSILKENEILSKEKFLTSAILRDRTKTHFPLSPAQERLWFIEQYEEGTNAYNVPAIYELEKDTDKEGIKHALQQIISRHEVLRSTIEQRADLEYDVQVIHDEPLVVEEVDLLDTEDCESLIKEDINQPFNLSTSYPIRVKFYTIKSVSDHSSVKRLLLINIHHIASDGWSRALFHKELLAHYEAYTNGDTSFALPALDIQYKDYASWQRLYQEGETLEKQLSYWKDKLSNCQTLELPTDYPRPRKTDYKGSSEEFRINKTVSQKLRGLARSYGVTLNSVMLSSFNILLGKYTDQEDIITGSPSANRHHKQTEELIGFFINTQTNRTILNKTQSYIDLIKQVHRDQIEAQLHQDLPFEKVVDELKVERDPSRHPIFQIIFEVQGFSSSEDKVQQKEYLKHYEIENVYEIERFDLSVFIIDSEEEILGHISYATSLFHPDTIKRLITHYTHLLNQLTEAPDRPYSEFSLMSTEEFDQVVYQWNLTDKDYSKHRTVIDLFNDQVKKTPDNIAVVFENTEITYRQLDEQSDKLANYLITTYDINANNLVGLMLNRSDKMIIALLGILKAGGAYLCIDPDYPIARKEFIIEDASLNVLITQSDYLFDLEFYTGNLFAVDLQLDDLDSPSKPIVSAIEPEDMAYVIYTSGTTGKPKGVMVPHRSVVNYMNNVNEVLLPEVRNIDFSTNIAFDLSVTTTICSLVLGKKMFIYSGELGDIESYARHLNNNKIDFIKGTPSLLANLPTNYLVGHKIKQAFIGGEKLEDYQLTQIANYVDNPVDEYGPTEATVGTTYINKGNSGNQKGIGKPYFNYKVYVLDSGLSPTPIGVIGELYIGGVGLSLGYLNRSELTKKHFINNPFCSESDKSKGYTKIYKTGDLVRWLSDGNLEYIGRNDQQVKIRGYRIEVGEIEYALTQIDEIGNACVLVKERNSDISNTKYLSAYYVTQNSDETISPTVIKDKLSKVLPDYMIPATFRKMESFPLTTNGKLDKEALPHPELDLPTNQNVPPTNEIEKVLYDIWKTVLGLEILSITDNFFSVGGDSILSIQVSSRVRQAGYACQVKDIFEHKTIINLAEYLSKKSTEIAIQTEQGNLIGASDFLPIQQWFFHKVDDKELENPNHWNQSFLVKVMDLDRGKLEDIICQLIDYHDVLRIKYVNDKLTSTDKNNWRQFYQSQITLPEVKTLDVSQHTKSEVQKILTDWQSNFNLENGTLFQTGYLHGYEDGSSAIYFALHHLIVDTVSWRILVEDMKALFSGIQLPAKGSSYRQWATIIKDYPNQFPTEGAYWEEQLMGIERHAALDSREEPSQKFIELNKELTASLLQEASQAYQTEVNDLLLTAFAYTLKEINHNNIQGITLEGHGREDIDISIDHSRTIGWFTTMFPVKLEIQNNLKESIQCIKENLRHIPNKGIGFGPFALSKSTLFSFKDLPLISFNYLGQFDVDDRGDWQIDTESGLSVDVNNKDHSLIKVVGMVSQGKIRFSIVTRFGEEITDQLGNVFESQLTNIISHCKEKMEKEGMSYTPSDFQNVQISQSLLDKLEAETKKNGNELAHIYPANSLQQGFIYHALSQREDDAYRVQVLIDYHEALDVDSYIKSWESCVAKYPSLRTGFNWDENIIQVIYKRGNLDCKLHDISYLSKQQERDQAIETIRIEDRKQSFDLTQPTQLRVHIIKQTEAYYTVLKTEHHSIADGWSGPVLFASLHQFYQEYINNLTSDNKEDAAYLQAQQYISQHKHSAYEYWNTLLAEIEGPNDINALLSKPIDASSYNKADQLESITLEVKDEVYERLKSFSNSEGITMNIIVQFAWHKLLQVYSNSLKSIVGTTVSGRDLPIENIEESVGLYINTLPLVVNWENHNSINEQLHQIQQQLTELNAHSIADLARLQKEGERIFHSLLVFENYPELQQEKDSQKISLRGGVEKVNYPISVLGYDHDATLIIKLKYDSEHLTNSKAKQHLNTLKYILFEIAENADQPHAKLSLLDSTEYDTVIYDWNTTEKEYPQDKTLYQLFQEQAAKTPDNIALNYEGQQLSYKELDEKSNQLAHYIRHQYETKTKQSLSADTLIAVCVDRGLEMVIGLMAVLKAGGAYVPISPSYSQERMDYILNDIKAALILSQRHLTEVNALLPHDAVVYIDLDETIYQKENTHALTSFSKSSDLAYLIYTSGTTGKPKGVMVEHRSITNLQFIHANQLRITSESKVLQYASLIFDASVWEIFSALSFGAQLIIASKTVRQDALLLIELLKVHEITLATLPPALLNVMPYEELPILQTLVVAGESCPTDLMLKWSRHRRLFNAYGPTETTICATWHEFEPGDLNNNIGKPLNNARVYVLDNALVPVPLGVPGELYIGGAVLARGYFNRSELTSERFIANPFASDTDIAKGYTRLYKTGDLVCWNADGNLEFIGRNDDQVKIRGHRIELGEIEHALSQIEGIKQVYVAARERQTEIGSNKYLVGYYVSNNGVIPESVIVDNLSQKLPDYMVPDTLIAMELFPLTVNGKLDKRALPDPDFGLSKDYVRPETELESKLCAIYGLVLGLPVDQISTHQNFFRMGGNSILIIQLKRKLNELEEFSLISIADLFKYNSINKLVQSIQQNNTTTYHLQNHNSKTNNHDIAIIGMSGAFSGANDINEFWDLIVNQKEGLRPYNEDECKELGVSDDFLSSDNYIPVAGKIDGVELFDPAFWEMSPNEAKQHDPQIRKFIEHCWLALESSGYASQRKNHNIGVFAGSGGEEYFYENVLHGELADQVNMWEAAISNSKDALATKVSFMLNLSGPANSINTACSTGLVSVVEACKNLQVGTCDMALAGGVAFSMPDNIGYLYKEGMIFSKDGHCRTFDKDSSGTISGSGVGVVLLKRLEDAVKDNDSIIAVIKGYASNNDGARKTSYTAPSVEGQSECIINAQRMAGITADQIDYVECHGTATNLGDPIEVQALREAFEYNSKETKFIKNKTILGAVKANIGHTGSAAGTAGLIKVCSMLQNYTIPGQVNFNEVNPELNLNQTNFEICTKKQSWLTKSNAPRLAGISSFGIGGTNAHIILGDYNDTSKTGNTSNLNTNGLDIIAEKGISNYIIPISAKTRVSMERYKQALITYLTDGKDPFIRIQDMAYTLQERREHFNFRTAYCARNTDELLNKLKNDAPYEQIDVENTNRIVFMFPGQGAQYTDMAKGLYDNEPVFKSSMDRCITLANRYLDADLFDIMYPTSTSIRYDINEIRWTPIALFVLEYSLADYLKTLGVEADAYIGHSFGEYVAATLSGVFSLEDGIKAVIARGRLMQQMEPGGMLAINARREDVLTIVEKHNCEISVINSPDDVVASGSVTDIESLHRTLDSASVPTVRINSLVAGHSRMMEKAAKEFEEVFTTIKLNKPSHDFISNLSGELAGEEVMTAKYWCDQLRNTVHFAKGMNSLSTQFNYEVTYIEVGAGKGLSYFVNKHKKNYQYKSIQTVQLLPSLKEVNTSKGELINSKEDLMVKLWMSGIMETPNEAGLFKEAKLQNGLPLYQFDYKKCWINKSNQSLTRSEQNALIDKFRREMGELSTFTKGDAVNLLETLLTPKEKKVSEDNSYSGVTIIDDNYSEIEGRMAQTFSDILGVEELSIYDDFFKIGGNSILAIKLSHRISETLECDMKVSDVFKLKTCNALAKNIKVMEVAFENIEKDY